MKTLPFVYGLFHVEEPFLPDEIWNSEKEYEFIWFVPLPQGSSQEMEVIHSL